MTTIVLLMLVAVGISSLGVAGYALVVDRRRQAILDRTLAGTNTESARRSALLAEARRKKPTDRLSLIRQLPTAGLESSKYAAKLTYAGYDSPSATTVFHAIRIGTLLMLPVLCILAWPFKTVSQMTIIGVGSLFIAWLLPIVVLERLAHARQEKVRRGLPDALDLLVVCVEAGISLDAAVLRVAKEIAIAFPDLSRELLVVNRKTNAGVSREEALRGLWSRTGIDELRALSSSLIQTEKWGTSITKVLRVSAATLRRKRRQHAEKRVAIAPVKMTLPLVTMILPALFIIILGPAVLQVIRTLSGTRIGP